MDGRGAGEGGGSAPMGWALLRPDALCCAPWVHLGVVHLGGRRGRRHMIIRTQSEGMNCR